MTEKPIPAVIWDMDGVIADTGTFHCRSWQIVFKKQGIDFTEDDFQLIFGQRNDSIIGQTIGREMTQSEIDSIANDKEVYFREAVKSKVKPFPGVTALLKTLKTNVIGAAIASSAPLENIKLILSEIGIADYFQAIVFGREVSEGKPSPQVYLKAAQKLGVEPNNCIVIEDAVAGVEGAKRAGMHCIAVTNTHEAAGLGRADLVVDSLEKVGLNELEMLFTMKNK
jgi:beta-phosphoglucomutase family hydrolase